MTLVENIILIIQTAHVMFVWFVRYYEFIWIKLHRMYIPSPRLD